MPWGETRSLLFDGGFHSAISVVCVHNRKNQAGPENSQKRPESAANMKNAMINELKTRNNRNLMVKPGVNEIQDGTFEGIILDMKSQPYRNEGMHRSFRRHAELSCLQI